MKPVNRPVCFLFVVLLLFVGLEKQSQAQGKLGRVREAVRKTNQVKPAGKVERTRDQVDADRKHDNRARRENSRDRRRKQSRNRRNRRYDVGNGVFVNAFVAPPVNQVHVIHHAAPVVPAPVFVPTLQADPIYQPVVAPIPEPTQIHIHEDAVNRGWMNSWGVRLSAFGGTDFDDISQGSLGLLLQAPQGLGIDSSVTMLRESGMSFRDHLYLGDVNLVYEPVVTDTFRLRLGIGVNWLGDSFGADAGFNMTSGFDWQLGRRWIATGEVDFGTLGDTDMTHAQISLGKRVSETTEWATGYDYRNIGGVTFGTAFTGLRFRF